MSDHRAPVLRQRFSRLAAAIAMGVFASAGAQAQSLLELYDAARAYDATYLSARSLAESAEYRAAQVGALAKPTIGLGAGSTLARNEPAVGLNANTITTTAGVKGTYAVYNRGNAITIEQSLRSLDVAKADLETAEQDLIVRVAQAYFDVLAAQDVLNSTRANKTGIAEQLASAKRNFEVGTSTITDTREAQARYDRSVAQEIAAENDLRVKRVALEQIVGRPAVEPKPLAQPVALPAVLPLTLDPWVAQADEQNPNVRKARLGLEVAQLETKKARAADGVTVDLNGSVGVSNLHTNLNLPAANTGAGTGKSASFGVSINYPLYNGGAIQNRVLEAMKLEEKSRNDLEYVRRLVNENTRRGFLGVQSLSAQVKALEAAEASSKLALESTQVGYRVGVRVNLDVLNAQTLLYTTQSDLAKARYDTLLTSLRLRQAAGQLRPEDVAAINQLLVK